LSTLGAWKTTPRRRRTSRAPFAGERPSTVKEPEEGGRSVARMRKSVVLPPPFGPRSAKVVPLSIEKETPSSARRSP